MDELAISITSTEGYVEEGSAGITEAFVTGRKEPVDVQDKLSILTASPFALGS